MAFVIDFTLEQPEQVRASRVMSHRLWSTWLTYALFLTLAIVVVALDLYWRFQGRPGAAWGVPVVLLLVGLACALVYASPYFTVRNMRKNSRAAGGPYRYILDDSGVDATALGVRTTLEWANISEVYESHGFLFLYVAKGYAVLIPKRVLQNDELPRLREALVRWVGARAKVSRTPRGDASSKNEAAEQGDAADKALP